MIKMLKKIEKFLLKKIKIYNVIFTFLIAIGIVIRTQFFIYNPSLFKDEANLARNLIETLNYLDFFSPLARLQVAPPMFMILSKFIYNFADITKITPYQSDLLLRVVPFICGILTIPAEGYLVWKIFKNRFITALGLGAISLYPLLITFSVNFKQYSMEALFTILIMIIALHITIDRDSLKKSMIKFALLATTPFFSMTSLYILPFVFIYLLITAKEKKQLKKFCYCSSIGIFIILIYYLIFLKGIIAAHYEPMLKFWYWSLHFNSYSFLIFALLGIIFSVNTKKIILYGCPIFLTLILILMHKYPCKDRLFIFIIPLIIIAFLFPIKFLIKKKYPKIKFPLVCCLLVSILYFLTFPMPIYKYRYQQEYGREIWSTLAKNYHKNAPILISKSINTNIYYNYFYNFDYILTSKVFKKSEWEKLSPNLYYVVITAPNNASKDMEFLSKQDGKSIKILNQVNYNHNGYYIVFRKLK